MKVLHSWLQTYFDAPLPSAPELAELLTFHAFEIEGVETVDGDSVIDVDVLPNRSSDSLSHRGIARELATLLSIPMKRDPLREAVPAWQTAPLFSVTVDNQTLCPRYIAAVVRGVTVGESPTWLKTALARLGQRSINNIVDATNYIMLNIGQPLHAFDVSKIDADDAGVRSIRVRTATAGERITLLTGEERELADDQLIISDGVAGMPLAVAGVKGGKRAEIAVDTVDILLEAATFDFVSVRTTSRALKLHTEASLRFQNEPGVLLPPLAMRDLITLVEELSGGVLEGVVDSYEGGDTEREPMRLELAHVNRCLGTALTIEDVEAILVRFEWEFSRSADTFTVTPAWERSDLTTEEALIEEIGRVHGYRSIVSVTPSTAPVRPKVHATQYYADQVRRQLTELGYSEVYTYLFADRGAVELLNPLAADKAFLRSRLHDSLVAALEKNAQNAAFLGLDDIRLFEVGAVFGPDGDSLSLGIGVRAVRGKQQKLETQMQRDLETVRGTCGVRAETLPSDGVVEMPLTPLFDRAADVRAYDVPLPWDTSVRYTPWSSYPCALRDIAVWVPAGVRDEEVHAVIVSHAQPLLVRSFLFDAYEKEGRTSYAWHLVLQAFDRTLSDDEIAATMLAVETAIRGHADWQVR